MPREVPEIDRLIEAGLTLYGHGDLDGALLQWEKALAIDPDNVQANSYVDYVRANYELLTSDANGERTTEAAPFGIADEDPEYQIEIQPGEIRASQPAAAAPEFMDPLDEGWFIDHETHDRSAAYGGPPALDLEASQELTLELTADEPPEPESPHTAEPPGPPEISFEDATREYDSKLRQPSGSGSAEDFGPQATPPFGHPTDFQTPPGFGTQITGIKQRDDLGFVKPASATSLGLPTPPRGPAKPSAPPAMTTHGLPPPRVPAPALEPPGPPPDFEGIEPPELTLEPAEPPTAERRPISAPDDEDLDLISSLPSPRPAPTVPRVEVETPLSGASTRDLPLETRAPAFSAAPTRELEASDVRSPDGTAQTGDFDAKTLERMAYGRAALAAAGVDPTLVSAPTRDLGLRDMAAAPEPQRPETAGGMRGGTRADVVLPFDPIDARATEILEAVDEAAPRDEPKEDQTRRRITMLFEHAAQWSSEGDLERAVAAVDLAMSEDPNSALAQKLIHRNRDTIMTVFQAYIGDLERTPQLARPLHELASAPISPRAAFLLSRIDGLLSIDEILDVCGMPRLEAYRYLCQLFLRGILR